MDPQFSATPLEFDSFLYPATINPDGSFQEDHIASFASLPANIAASSYPMTVSTQWNDKFQLPNSPAGDVFKLYEYQGGCDPNACEPNPPGTGVIDVSSGDTLHTYSDVCDINQGACQGTTYTLTSTGRPVTVAFLGSYSFSFDGSSGPFPPELSGNVTNFNVFVDVTRFHADGTPDPFAAAPEPATWLLSMIALMGFIGTKRFRRGR